MNQVLKYTTLSIGGSLESAIGTIFSDYLKKKSSGFETLSGLERWNNLDVLVQTNPITPCLFDLKNVNWTQSATDLELELEYAEGNLPLDGSSIHTIDYYTLETKDLYNEVNSTTKIVESTDLPIARICGNYVLGNFTDVLFPKYDPNQDNILTDVFAACVASAFKNDFQSSYGYLRFGQMLLSFFKENAETMFETDGNKRNFNQKLFKL